jgi:hypothetical protein
MMSRIAPNFFTKSSAPSSVLAAMTNLLQVVVQISRAMRRGKSVFTLMLCPPEPQLNALGMPLSRSGAPRRIRNVGQDGSFDLIVTRLL